MNQFIKSRPYPNTTAFHVAFLSFIFLCFFVLILFAGEAGINHLEYVILTAVLVFLVREIYIPLQLTIRTERKFTPPTNGYMPAYPVRISKDNSNYAVDLGVLKFIAISADVLKNQEKFNNICGHEYAHIYFKDGIFVNTFKLVSYVNVALIIYILLTFPYGGESMIIANEYSEIFLILLLVFLFSCFYARKTIHEREYNADYFSLSINGFSFLNYLKSWSDHSQTERPVLGNLFNNPFSHPSIQNRVKKLKDPKKHSNLSIFNLALLLILLSSLLNMSINYLNSFSTIMPDLGEGVLYVLLIENSLLRKIVELIAQLSIYYYLCSEIVVLSISRNFVLSLATLLLFTMIILLGFYGLAFSFPEFRNAPEIQQYGAIKSLIIFLGNTIKTPASFILAALLIKIISRYKTYRPTLTLLVSMVGIFVLYFFEKVQFGVSPG